MELRAQGQLVQGNLEIILSVFISSIPLLEPSKKGGINYKIMADWLTV